MTKLLLFLIAAISLSSLDTKREGPSSAGEQITFGPFAETGPAPSPDGRWLLFEYFHRERPNLPTLWIMPTNSDFSEARPLADNDDYNGEPSWSPDSEWVCYQALSHSGEGNRLFKLNISTGERIQLTQLPQRKSIGDSTTWSVQGTIAFEFGGDIHGLDAKGGVMRKLLDTRRRFALTPPAHLTWSPNGTKLAFATENEDTLKSQIWTVDVKTSTLRQITREHTDTFPAWLGNDHLLLTRMLGENESWIGIIHSSGGTPKWLTQGHDDLTPEIAPTGDVLFFARATEPKPNPNNFNIFAGFHIWRVTVAKGRRS